jgi:hypothetical protein
MQHAFRFFWKKGGQRATRRTCVEEHLFLVPEALIKLLETSQTYILFAVLLEERRASAPPAAHVFSPPSICSQKINPDSSKSPDIRLSFWSFGKKDEQERTTHMYRILTRFDCRKNEEETPMTPSQYTFETSPMNSNLRNTEEKKEQKQAAQGRDLYSNSCQASVVCPRRSYHITSRRPQAHKHQPD